MSGEVIILRGLPGAGKSHWAKKNRTDQTEIVSADRYFISQDGSYQFNPAKLGEAHQACFRNFLQWLRVGVGCIIVDNTNISELEIAPYYLAAETYGYGVKILNFPCDVETAVSRNIHGVSRGPIEKMVERSEKFNPPPWWTIETCLEEEARSGTSCRECGLSWDKHPGKGAAGCVDALSRFYLYKRYGSDPKFVEALNKAVESLREKGY